MCRGEPGHSHHLEYDHSSNQELELLSGAGAGADPDDLFTFNNHEIYITDEADTEADERGFQEDFNFEGDQVAVSVYTKYLVRFAMLLRGIGVKIFIL